VYANNLKRCASILLVVFRVKIYGISNVNDVKVDIDPEVRSELSSLTEMRI